MTVQNVPPPRLSAAEAFVLREQSPDYGFFSASLAERSEGRFDQKQILEACRANRKRGLMVLSPVLDEDSGLPNGSAYWTTPAGERALAAARIQTPDYSDVGQLLALSTCVPTDLLELPRDTVIDALRMQPCDGRMPEIAEGCDADLLVLLDNGELREMPARTAPWHEITAYRAPDLSPHFTACSHCGRPAKLEQAWSRDAGNEVGSIEYCPRCGEIECRNGKVYWSN